MRRYASRRLLACLLLSVLLTACGRKDYRLRADRQAYDILAEKMVDPRWSVPDFDVTADPRSRFFDPHDIDNPPMPPDDAAARRFVENSYGMEGAARWRQFPVLAHVENSKWPTYLGGEPYEGDSSELPAIRKLTLAAALELGMVHSRDYQEQLENMYLAALPLTFERFRFDLQIRGFSQEPGSSLSYLHQPDDRSDMLLGPTVMGIQRLLPTGAQFIAELSNNTLWLLAGSSQSSTASGLAFSLVQPLLNQAGREVVLERLTQSERNVLYTIRDFSRFRKDFYVTVVTGERAIPLPGSAARGELAFLIRGERSPTVGFNQLLYRLQRLRNTETIVRSLRGLIQDLASRVDSDAAQQLAMTQLQSSLEITERYAAFRKLVYETQLDRFKMQLGLPPDMELELDDSQIRQFDFLDAELQEVEYQLTVMQPGTAVEQVREAAGKLQDHQLVLVKKLEELRGEFTRLLEILPRRYESLEEQRAEKLRDDIELDRQSLLATAELVANLKAKLEKLKTDTEAAQSDEQVEALAGQLDEARDGVLRATRKLASLAIVIRLESVELVPIQIDQDAAVRIALDNRLDLMNRRGIVADARRKIDIAADQLEATLNVVAEGELRTDMLGANNNPVEFRAEQSDFRVGLQVVTPVARRKARNDFRASQISYQRARRNYMVAEDQVKLDVRQQLRQAKAMAFAFEANRRAIRFATRELDQATELGDANADAATGLGVNLSRALDNFLETHNELIESWVDYEQARLSVYRDMGQMHIDEFGFWNP